MHEGINTHRLCQNPREQAFYAEWNKIADSTLMSILDETHSNARHYYDAREAEVAATVIQWLGSPVGQCFLEKVKVHIVEASYNE